MTHLMLALVLLVPPGQATLSDAERALLAAYRAALAGPALAKTTRREALRQVESNPPLAFVDGYWVTPVNVVALLQDPAVHDALRAGASNARELAQAEEILGREARLPRLVGLAFTAHPLSATIGVPHAAELAPASLGSPVADAVLLVVLKDVDQVVIEYLPPPPAGPAAQDGGCRFFCGDPATWDFDGDGIPNREDPDDDGDGVDDTRDAYPFWPGAASCDCGERRFTGFTEQFSAGVTRTVLRARAWIDDPARIVSLREEAAGSPVRLRLVFPWPMAGPADDVRMEFVMAREGGRCVTKQGGTLCRVVLTVRDDGTWEATGVLPPAPAEGTVEQGAASRLAAVLEGGWKALTAQPFTGTCPRAYDGQERWYAVRRLPAADVRELRGCKHDLEHPGARAVLERLEALWRELGLPGA